MTVGRMTSAKYMSAHDYDVDSAQQTLTLLNDRLDGLVDVVMDVLAGDDGSGRAGLGYLALNAPVDELSGLTLEAGSDVLGAAVLEVPVLDSSELVLVLLRQDLTVEHGLHGGVVVVLVDLLVDGGLDLLVEVLVDGLVGDGGSDLLVDGGVVVAGLGPARDRALAERGERRAVASSGQRRGLT